MPRKRNREHKGLPERWRWKNGAYRYLVPKGQEHLWDGKTEFKLGKTRPEAHMVYAGRLASIDGAIQTFNELIDRYLLDISSQIEGDKMVFTLEDPGAPALIKDSAHEDATYVLMPMRV